MKNYQTLTTLDNFALRLKYLHLGDGLVHGSDPYESRPIKQQFYQSIQWRRVRDQVILRDNGCDLGIQSRPIFGKILVHHIVPITTNDILNGDPKLIRPSNLICTSIHTHNAIHTHGELDELTVVVRFPGDTTLWK